MGFYRHPRIFDPLDLEIIDRVYETAWARLEAQEPLRDRERDREREEQLRKLVFSFAHTCKIYGNVDFDELSEMVIEHLPGGWIAPLGKKSSGSTPKMDA